MKTSGSSAKSPRRSRAQPVWAKWDDDELLELRMKDLNVSFEGTWLSGCLRDLNKELKAKGLAVRPHGWLSDEWFSPDTTAGIAFPFYLAHPRLTRLERKMAIGVEGGTQRDAMRILRHEAGHVLQHAYKLHRRRKWQQLFGRSSTRYPEYYRPDPTSRDYVQHLGRWYAQCHPDEDFAETFAVWLTPRSAWRKRYADWPALEKLLYVDELMAEIAGEKPILTNHAEVDPVSKMTKTLGDHYRAKLEHYSVTLTTPATFDRELQRIFSSEPRHRGAPSASAFIRRNRAEIRRSVTKWNGEHQLTLDAVLDDMIDRCRTLKLKIRGSETRLRQNLTLLLTNQAMPSLYTPSRHRWFAV